MTPITLDNIDRSSRIVVAMSGGVDSTVCAALLAHSGYDVIGITLRLYNHGKALKKQKSCCSGQDIKDAKRAAAMIGIPHYVIDYESKFRDEVITPFIDSYLRGETPVPCISCNQSVKFRDLLEIARSLGAKSLVTGHYATIKSIEVAPGVKRRALFRATESQHDQSYFLFNTTQEQLDYINFPLGEFTKEETRAFAQTLGLSVATKPDSQDICFVPEGGYHSMINKLNPSSIKEGPILDMSGKQLGTHRGIVRYTIGQRRGLGLSTANRQLFVVHIDSESNSIIVGPREELAVSTVPLRDLHWLGEQNLDNLEQEPIDLFVKLRSSQSPIGASLVAEGEGTIAVELSHSEYGVSPGQACAFYSSDDDDARVLGGAWIDRPKRKSKLSQQDYIERADGKTSILNSLMS